MSLADLRKQLREMKKVQEKPISKMKKADISSEIERMRKVREETPAPAATPSAPHKAISPAVESVKEAKKKEFPVKPSEMPKKEVKAPKPSAGKKKDIVAEKVKMSKAKLLALIQGMDSDAE